VTEVDTYQRVIELRKQILAGQLDSQGRLVGHTFAIPGGRVYNRLLASIKAAHLLTDERYTWDRWDPKNHSLLSSGDRPACPTELALSWLKSLTSGKKPKPWTYLWGPVGVGKSHLACILGTYWVASQSVKALRINWSTWLQEKRDSYNQDDPDSLNPELYAKHLITMPFLIIDDISMELTEHSLKHLYLVLEGRVASPTILTSNLNSETLRKQLQRGKSVEAQDWGIKVADRLGTGVDGRVQISLALENKNGQSRRQVESV